jgi:HEAT repeat protein
MFHQKPAGRGVRHMLTIVGTMALFAVASACAPSRAPDESSAATVENLRMVLQDTELRQREPDRVVKAIQKLGRLRAAEAIPDLVNLLGFRYWRDWEKKPGPVRMGGRHLIYVGTRYPATEALVEIGKPALPALLEVVETREFDSIESKNARYTIRMIFRGEPPKADDFLKEAAAQASVPEAKRRLLKALETAEGDMRLGKEDFGK